MSRGARIPVRFVLVFWLFLLSAVAFLDRTNISIAGIFLSTEYRLSNTQLGSVFSAFLLGYAAFQVPGGWLARRVGPRRVLTFGVLWWGVFTILTTTVPTQIGGSLLLLIAVRFALGAGEAVIYPASNQFIARWVPVRERGRANGWIFAGVGAGSGLTPPLLTWIIAHHGWRASFWFSAVVGFVAGAVWFLIARDRPEQHPYASPEEVTLIREGLGAAAVDPLVESSDRATDGRTPWLGMLKSVSVLGDYVQLLHLWLCRMDFLSWFYSIW